MRIGVIGVGSWGSRVAGEYISLLEEGKINSISLCDIDESKLAPFKKRVSTFTDLNSFLKKVDAVHVCTNNQTHYELTKIALEHSKHVLVEKPMTLNSAEALDLIERASSKGCILQVGHIFRFANVIKKVKELVKEGYFGELYYFNLRWSHRLQPIEGVDILWDLLPHPIDILHFITELWPLKFIGIGKPYRRKYFNEMANIQAIYDNGLVANIHLSWLTFIRARALEIVGSKCTALVECVKQKMEVYRDHESEVLTIEANNTIRGEIINFLEAIKTGKSYFNTDIIGAKVVEVIEKALHSLR